MVIDNRRHRVVAMSLASAALLGLAVFLTSVGSVSVLAWLTAAFFGGLAIRDALYASPVIVDLERRTLRGPVFAFFAQIGAVVLYRRGEPGSAGVWVLAIVMPGAAAMASISRQLAVLEKSPTPYRDSGDELPALELRGGQTEVHDVLAHTSLSGVQEAAERLAAAVGVSLIDLAGDPQCVRPDLSERTISFDVSALRRDVLGMRKTLAEKT